MRSYLKTFFFFLSSLAFLAFYLMTSFIVGWEYLTNIQGSDTLVFLSHLKLLADYFPHYPFWNYLEGGGVALVSSYPVLTHTLIIIISKFAHLNLVETLKLVGFLSVPMFAWGIYFFAYTRTKNILASFLSGVFYVISPIAWIFLFEWGFYAESVAAVFFAPILIFFTLYLDSPKRVYLVIASLFLALSILAHPTIATAALTFMVIYSGALALVKKNKFKSFVSSAKAIVVATILGVFLSAIWFFPYYNYSKIASLGANIGGGIRIDEYERNKLYLTQVLGFTLETDRGNPVYNFRNLSFPWTISLLFIVGSILVLFSKKKDEIALGISAWLLLGASISVSVTVILKHIPILDNFASWRSFIYIPRVLIPFLAASAGYYLFYYLFFFIKKYPCARILAASFLGFLATAAFIFLNKEGASYGKEISMATRKIDDRDIWKVRFDDPCKVEGLEKATPYCAYPEFVSTFNVPEFRQICIDQRMGNGICGTTITKDDVDMVLRNCGIFCTAKYDSLKNQIFDKRYWAAKIAEFRQNEDLGLSPRHEYKKGELVEKRSELDQYANFRRVFNVLPDNPFGRYDLSVEAVELSKLSPYFKKTSPALPSYINQAWLNSRFWGYELSNFYADDPVYADYSTLLSIAQWYGIKYIVFGGSQDEALPRFDREGFIKVDEQPLLSVDNQEINIAVNNKPKVLVIGNTVNPVVYDEVFKKGNLGILPYSSTVLVKGSGKIDDYNLEDLKEYDLLFLYGYSYNNQNKAWGLVDSYIKDGGRVFIDTGWQYVSKDWNVAETPDFLPTKALAWTNFGVTSDYRVDSTLFDNSNVDVASFEPLIWNGGSWGVSSGELKDWSFPILSVEGGVLMAGGEYGQGKIVWSGMNSLGHIKKFDGHNPEVVLLKNAFDWLLGQKEIDNLISGSDFSVRRINPDKVELTFKKDLPEGYGIYFKESYFPYWKTDSGYKIDYAGPGFMYVGLPEVSSGDKIVIFMGVMPAQILGYAGTVSGIFLVFLYLSGKIRFSFLNKIKPSAIGLGGNEEDTDY